MTDPLGLPRTVSRPIRLAEGEGVGISNRWDKGQYCCILTKKGIVACAMYDLEVCNEFGHPVAMAKGTPAKPLTEPEDLLPATIVKVSEPARKLGITEGMTGAEALALFLKASADS